MDTNCTSSNDSDILLSDDSDSSFFTWHEYPSVEGSGKDLK